MVERLVSLALVAGVVSFVLVGLVRGLALRHDLLDHPTERSSHAVATPRGGGLGLVVAALAISAWHAIHPARWALLLLLVAASAVALVGWLDDRRGLSVRARLVVHAMAGAAMGATAAASATTTPLVLLLFAWWTFWAVSSINLVNFMDGINGLVASQIAVFAISLACFPDPSNVAAISVAGACLGFLPWNFPSARIFLGDVGSGALGFLVPMLALLAMQGQGIDIVRAHLPLLPLFGDATWTIIRRWRNGERLTAPHRSHLYQRLANDGLGHTAVTAMYTIAAVCGALAAHLSGDAWVSPWTLSYAALTAIAGYLLHRRATGGRRVAT